MTASHDRRRSNTSPSISQAPEPLSAPMPLESGGSRPPADGERLSTGVFDHVVTLNLSGARDGSMTEGGETLSRACRATRPPGVPCPILFAPAAHQSTLFAQAAHRSILFAQAAHRRLSPTAISVPPLPMSTPCWPPSEWPASTNSPKRRFRPASWTRCRAA